MRDNGKNRGRLEGSVNVTEASASPGRRLILPSVLAVLFAVVVPFVAYILFWNRGWDISRAMFIVILAALSVTTLFTLLEGLVMLRNRLPDDDPDEYPPASVLLSATAGGHSRRAIRAIEALLYMDYPAPIKIILLHRGTLQGEMQDLVEKDDRIVPHRVDEGGAAQALRAVLREVEGAFTAIFSANEIPGADSFRRAWQWIAMGHQNVYGRTIVENGDVSLVTHLAAAELGAESLVGEPGGRYGAIGFSNRFLASGAASGEESYFGGKKGAVFDPHLTAWYRAPTTPFGVWWTETRKARRWLHVSFGELRSLLTSPDIPGASKVAMLDVLGWRPVGVWLTIQLLPLALFWAYRDFSTGLSSWTTQIILAAVLFYLEGGLLRTIFAYAVAPEDVKLNRSWFFQSALLSPILYAPLRSQAIRMAQMRDLVRGEGRSGSLPAADSARREHRDADEVEQLEIRYRTRRAATSACRCDRPR
jgi:hypothetical protein